MMPLMGAASAKTQKDDPVYEGQRLLKECRHLNSTAGIALGIRDFAPNRRSVREIGIVQWNKEINEMFEGGRIAQAAYRLYAEQIKQAVNRALPAKRPRRSTWTATAPPRSESESGCFVSVGRHAHAAQLRLESFVLADWLPQRLVLVEDRHRVGIDGGGQELESPIVVA